MKNTLWHENWITAFCLNRIIICTIWHFKDTNWKQIGFWIDWVLAKQVKVKLARFFVLFNMEIERCFCLCRETSCIFYFMVWKRLIRDLESTSGWQIIYNFCFYLICKLKDVFVCVGKLLTFFILWFRFGHWAKDILVSIYQVGEFMNSYIIFCFVWHGNLKVFLFV